MEETCAYGLSSTVSTYILAALWLSDGVFNRAQFQLRKSDEAPDYACQAHIKPRDYLTSMREKQTVLRGAIERTERTTVASWLTIC